MQYVTTSRQPDVATAILGFNDEVCDAKAYKFMSSFGNILAIGGHL